MPTRSDGSYVSWDQIDREANAPRTSTPSTPRTTTGSSPGRSSSGGSSGGSSLPSNWQGPTIPTGPSSVIHDQNMNRPGGWGSSTPVPPVQPPVNPYQQQLEEMQRQMQQQQDYQRQLEEQRRQAEEEARRLAAAETARLTQERTRIADQTKGSLRSSYDRANQMEGDQRAMQDQTFARKNNPFSGGTDYLRAQLAREREITDRQQTEDLNSKLSGIDTSLQDYVNASPTIRAQLEADLINRERNYSLNAGNQFLQANNQQFNQMMDQFRTLAPYQYMTAYEQNALPLQWAQTMGSVPAPMSTMNQSTQIQSLMSEIQRRQSLGQSASDLVDQLERLLG